MSFSFNKKLPVPKEIKEEYPVPESLMAVKKVRDQEIADIFTGKSDKFLAIIGPCSADNEASVMDYCERLARVQEKIKDRVIIIPRIYTNKPRTTGEGYKGMLHQPDPTAPSDLFAGLVAIRKMHIDIAAATGLTAADEMLYPENHWYLDDVLSYVAIGARSVEDQQHRLTASGISVPCGMKNPTSGTLSVMFNSIHAAQLSHNFIYRGWDVTTTGNEYAHAILRGSVTKHGQVLPNYHFEDMELVLKMYEEQQLKNPAVIVDTNHCNSGKRFEQQPRIVSEILHSRKYSPAIKNLVKGVMIESYIEEGAQKVGDQVYGKSITDPCLGWEASERLLLDMAERA
ncbi:MAG: 3-deoxy-7-phosphoheptulonate synthase [Lachnospiraceae bacterium]|nr:3-deoxy-7-phosphoheptulonate synthase [Lachnospiraceae bacterium]